MRNSRAVIHLDNFVQNLEAIRTFTRNSSAICLAVKADGYGHGALPISKTAISAGIGWLAVSSVEEGLELREAGIECAILLLGVPIPEDIRKIVAGGLSAVVTDSSLVKLFEQASAELGLIAKVHLKIDTGMGRIGCPPHMAPALALEITESGNLTLEGTCTHFPVADEASRSYTINQISRFRSCLDNIRGGGLNPGIVHAANSAGIESYPEAWFDMIRPGIAAYGYSQSPKKGLVLKPVMELRSNVVFIKDVEAGTRLSYGHTYTVPDHTTIATVAAGYADGYRRELSNRGQVLIRGRRAPVVGTVCMDQFLADVGSGERVERYDEVTLFGPDPKGPDADELANICGTIPYEIICGVSGRIPRIYKPADPAGN